METQKKNIFGLINIIPTFNHMIDSDITKFGRNIQGKWHPSDEECNYLKSVSKQ